MAPKDDAETVAHTHNVARFFTENRQISWVLLFAVFIWGVYGYINMPKRKDPNIPVRVATAVTPWPGVSAEKVDLLVTRQVEDKIAENSVINPPAATTYGIKSLTLPGVSIVQIQLNQNVDDTEKEFNDINLKLNAINDNLPQGAGPIQFNSGFGETAALLVTVASPKESDVEISLRARDIAQAIDKVRSEVPVAERKDRVSLIVALPRTISPKITRRGLDLLSDYLKQRGLGEDIRPVAGPGFAGIDVAMAGDKASIETTVRDFLQQRLKRARFHPDAWDVAVIRDPKQTEARLSAVRGDKYSYHQLDDITDLMSRSLLSVPQVSKINRSGVLPRQVYLTYSQDQLASYGVQPSNINDILTARNTTIPGGVISVEDMNVLIEPSGQFTDANQIGDVIITTNSDGTPVYLRDLVDILPGYQDPPQFLNFFSWQDDKGQWQRSRAISLAVQMRTGEQISEFGKAVNIAMAQIEERLPRDLIFERTSDQPLQSEQNIDLFMTALYEAVGLVVLVALLGFWEWRSALMMMLSIPITLSMTFGIIDGLGIELQQVSIATLIVALGLLVDDPVVANDAIKRNLAAGHPRIVAAWLGPTKLAKAIMFSTVTNVVAYLPFLLLTGNTGDFLFSLPVVMAVALLSSRLVSMSFIPFLGYFLLRPRSKPEPTMEERRTKGFTGFYFRVGSFAIRHRKLVFLASLSVLALGVHFKSELKNSFFPDDVQYLFYVDVWMRNDATLISTNETTKQTEEIIRKVATEFGKTHPDDNGQPRDPLVSIATFIGGGAPRFWFSVTPELRQVNYAQVLVRLNDKDDTPQLVGPLQEALSASVPGAQLDVRQLQTNPVKYPVAVRLTGRATIDPQQSAEANRTLSGLADQVAAIMRAVPIAARARGDWGRESFEVKLQIEPDRANLAGITNQDVAVSSSGGISGMQVATLREGETQIPVVARLRLAERAQLSDLNNLYVYAEGNTNKVPLLQIASLAYDLQTERIRRLEHFPTITVIAYPVAGVLPSQVYNQIADQLQEFEKTMPPGYTMDVAGEHAHMTKGFRNLAKILAISAAAIYLALVFQFRSAIKPLLVFAAVPYGVTGALAALLIMGAPFGFMAFLGIISLIGVIVSHVIVLFDFIEEMRAKGEPLEEALLDAGIIRLRPVMITVGATVLALFPLAIHGGPLWQPLCYAQIGGLTVATFITLLLVPVLYSIFVLDLKIVKWEPHHWETRTTGGPEPAASN